MGTEKDLSYDNSAVTKYGHVGIVVPDVYSFCDELMRLNVTFVKKPDEGLFKGGAFVLDPDGYWIEIFTPDKLRFGMK